MSEEATSKEWKPADVDHMLEFLLNAKNEQELNGWCDTLAEEMNRGTRTDWIGHTNGDLVRRKLWGVFLRATNYRPTAGRSRCSGAWSWVEQHYIKVAMETDAEEAKKGWARHGKPDATYWARVMQRSLADTERGMRQYGPDQGRKSFGL